MNPAEVRESDKENENILPRRAAKRTISEVDRAEASPSRTENTQVRTDIPSGAGG